MGKIKRIKKNLLSDEHILYSCSMHWGIFISPFIFVLIGALVWHLFHPVVGGAILFVSTFPVFNAAILYGTTELAVTTKRVVAFYGLFTTDLTQIGLNRMESALVEQTFLGQILDYYTVTVRGTGTGDIVIPFLTDGDHFKTVLDEILYAESKDKAIEKIRKANIAEKSNKKSGSKKSK